MISNATCIICLSRLNKLELLEKVYGKILIPPAVKEEICFQEKTGFLQIESALSKKWLIVEKPKTVKNFGLHDGENETICLSLEKKQPVILDDKAAILIAKSLGIETERTTTTIFRAIAKKIITKIEGIETLNKLIENGYYIAPAEYSKLLTKLSEK